MNIVHIILPILVGAVIGYFTNYIAIKMLFHPQKPIYIGKWKLPFTPGVIPQNQPRIAKAVGMAVGEQLFTAEDLVSEINNSSVKEEFVNKIVDTMMESEEPIHALCETGHINERELGEKLGGYIGNQIVSEVEKTDLMPIIKNIGDQSLDKLLHNPMIAMFLNEERMGSIYHKVGDGIKEYVKLNGNSIITAFVINKTEEITQKSVGQNLESLSIEKKDIQETVSQLFDVLSVKVTQTIVDKIDISGIVQTKINEMKIDELEKLVMAVMKQELQTVINLGALIGAVIGTINIFI